MPDPEVITNVTVKQSLLQAANECAVTVVNTLDINVAQKAAAAALDCVKALEILQVLEQTA